MEKSPLAHSPSESRLSTSRREIGLHSLVQPDFTGLTREAQPLKCMGTAALWRATVVARRTGIPTARLLEGEREKLLQLADH